MKIESGPTPPLVLVEVAVVEEGQPGAVQVEGQGRVEEVSSSTRTLSSSLFLDLVTLNNSAINLSKDPFWLIKTSLKALRSSLIAFFTLSSNYLTSSFSFRRW